MTRNDNAEELLESVEISLKVNSGEYSPNEISRMLGVEPTDSVTKGKEFRKSHRTGQPMIGKINFWEHSTFAECKKADLRAHLEYFLTTFEQPKAMEGLLSLRKEPEITVRIDLSLWFTSLDGGFRFNLDQELQRRLANLNLEIVILLAET
jgi:hypothetical protein